MKRYYLVDLANDDDDDDGDGNESNDDDDDDDDDDFNVMEILDAQEREVASRSNKSKYRCTKHILTTSTVVECLFTRAKLILCDKRSSMTPHHARCFFSCIVTEIFGVRQRCTNAHKNHFGATMKVRRRKKS
jgi:hypothetical protein